MKYSVIIPTYNDDDRLNKCLKALNKQTISKDQFEVIVVNNQVDREVEIVNPGDLNLIVLKEDKPGSYAARNLGIKHSSGEILAFTDSDCIPDDEWLQNGIDYLLSNKGISRLGGQIKLYFKSDELTFTEIYEKAFAFRQSEYVSNSGAAVTANMFSKKKVFDEVGLFNDDFLSGEDINWGIKAQNEGHKIAYCSEAIVIHPARYSFSELTLKANRVAGGLEDRFNNQKNFNTLTIIRGFLPPLFTIPKLLNNANLDGFESIISFFIHYYLKALKSFMILKYKLGFGNKERF